MPAGGAWLTYAMLVAGKPAAMHAWKADAADRHSGSLGAVWRVAMHLQCRSATAFEQFHFLDRGLQAATCESSCSSLLSAAPAQDGHQRGEHLRTQLTGHVVGVHRRGDADHLRHGGCRDKGLPTLAVLRALGSKPVDYLATSIRW